MREKIEVEENSLKLDENNFGSQADTAITNVWHFVKLTSY